MSLKIMFQIIKENVWYILNNVHACKKYVYHVSIFNIIIYHVSFKKNSRMCIWKYLICTYKYFIWSRERWYIGEQLTEGYRYWVPDPVTMRVPDPSTTVSSPSVRGGHAPETCAASSDMPPHHPACMKARCDAPVALLPPQGPRPG